jgi:hypothetical protein
MYASPLSLDLFLCLWVANAERHAATPCVLFVKAVALQIQREIRHQKLASGVRHVHHAEKTPSHHDAYTAHAGVRTNVVLFGDHISLWKRGIRLEIRQLFELSCKWHSTLSVRNLGTKIQRSHKYSDLPSTVPLASFVTIYGKKQQQGQRTGPLSLHPTVMF